MLAAAAASMSSLLGRCSPCAQRLSGVAGHLNTREWQDIIHQDMSSTRAFWLLRQYQMAEQGVKRARTAESGMSNTQAVQQPPAGRPQLLLVKTELQSWLGKKYCDEA
jgi:hypothetical protein